MKETILALIAGFVMLTIVVCVVTWVHGDTRCDVACSPFATAACRNDLVLCVDSDGGVSGRRVP